MTSWGSIQQLQPPHVHVYNTQDITELTRCVHLKALTLYCHARVLEGVLHDSLGAWKELEDLDLSFAPLRTLSGLCIKCPLRRVCLRNTFIAHLPPTLGQCPLEKLDLCRTYVSDLTPLQGLKTLTELNLERTRVYDLSVLSTLRFIEN